MTRTQREIAVNLGFAALEVGFSLLVIQLAATRLLPVALGLFLLARRLSNTTACLAQAGSSRTILRYGGLAGSDTRAHRDLAAAGLVGWLGMSALLLPLAWLLRRPLNAWVFPGSHGMDLTMASALAVVGWVGFYVSSSVLLADRHNLAASLQHLVSANGLIALLLWIGAGRWNVARLIGLQGAIVAGVAIMALAIYLLRLRLPWWPGWGAVRRQGRSLAEFGLPRSFNDFLDLAAVSVAPFLMRANMAAAGYLLIALSVVRLCEAVILPIVKLAGVITAQLLGRGDQSAIAAGTRLLFGALIYLAALAIAGAAPWCPLVLHWWLRKPDAVAGVMQPLGLLIYASAPLVLYHGLKNVIDAHWVAPRNTVTLALGVGVQVVLFYLLQPFWGDVAAAALSVFFGLWVLGAGSVYWIHTLLPRLGYFGLGHLTVVAAVVFAAAELLSRWQTLWAAAASAGFSLTLIGACFGPHCRIAFVHEFWNFLTSGHAFAPRARARAAAIQP